MAVKKILLLGNPKLYEISQPVLQEDIESIEKVAADLRDTLLDFRAKHGKGRAVAAPQIGFMKRVIYVQPDNTGVIINPGLSELSDEMIELWDDCMSFPDLLVKVRRHKRCRLRYRGLDWNEKEIVLEGDMAELIQHEFDHLEGTLAVSRATGPKAFALKSESIYLQ